MVFDGKCTISNYNMYLVAVAHLGSVDFFLCQGLEHVHNENVHPGSVYTKRHLGLPFGEAFGLSDSTRYHQIHQLLMSLYLLGEHAKNWVGRQEAARGWGLVIVD